MNQNLLITEQISVMKHLHTVSSWHKLKTRYCIPGVGRKMSGTKPHFVARCCVSSSIVLALNPFLSQKRRRLMCFGIFPCTCVGYAREPGPRVHSSAVLGLCIQAGVKCFVSHGSVPSAKAASERLTGVPAISTGRHRRPR